MKKKNNSKKHWLQLGALRMARIHFVFVAILAIQTILFDVWKLITPEAVMRRWYVTGGLLAVNALVWYIVRGKLESINSIKLLVFMLIFADIAAASFNVYTQRGMASRAVMLYVVPVIISSVLMSRSAIFATALIAAAAYVGTAISYFVLNFNEGYKIELYGEVGFYATLLLVLASFLWSVVRAKQNHTIPKTEQNS